MAKKRAPREAPPPGKYCRSRTGNSAARIRLTSKRTKDGAKLYQLMYLTGVADDEIGGSGRWTLRQLTDAGVRFMQRRPRVTS
jgi:hypothetical protein